MIYIGVDPGKNGGFAVIDGDKITTRAWDDADFADTCRFMSIQHDDNIFACVEKVGAMPGQGVVSMFNFGKSAGYIEGVLCACNIPYQLITPQTWKKEFMLNNSKQKSIEICKRLFPTVNLFATSKCRKPHDGMAEALLIALYAKRKRF